MDIDKYKSRIEQLVVSGKNLIPSSKSSSKLEHNPLPDILEYAFLREENTLSENILSSVDDKK